MGTFLIPPRLSEEIFYLSKEMVEVNISTQEDPNLIKIGAWLALEERERYSLLLKDFSNVFTWSYSNMHGLDPSFITHSLVVSDNAKLIQ